MPEVLARVSALTVILVFVLVLLRWGHRPLECVLLLSAATAVTARVSQRISPRRPRHA